MDLTGVKYCRKRVYRWLRDATNISMTGEKKYGVGLAGEELEKMGLTNVTVTVWGER